MSEISEIFGRLLWAVALSFAIVFALFAAVIARRVGMKALELSRLCAEKGIDPSPAPAVPPGKRRGALEGARGPALSRRRSRGWE